MGVEPDGIVSSERWRRFLETTALGLHLNITVFPGSRNEISFLKDCPICRRAYQPTPLEAGQLMDHSNVMHITFSGDVPVLARECPCMHSSGLPNLAERVHAAQQLVYCFSSALQEGYAGGQCSVELSALRRMNYTLLSLLNDSQHQGAGLSSFELILSALIILLDAEGSWLKLDDRAEPLIRGDEGLVQAYLRTGIECDEAQVVDISSQSSILVSCLVQLAVQ